MKSDSKDWGRKEYKRSDLGALVRGKYSERLTESSNVVVLEPEVAEVFPNDEAVNKALRSLISTKRKPKKMTLRNKRTKTSTSKKHRAA